MHLGRCLGAGRHLEFDLDPVDGVLFAGVVDVDGGDDQRHLPQRRGLAEPTADLALRPARQHRAVHVGGAAGHRGARIDVLLHRVVGEPLRRDDGHRAGVHLGLRGHTQHTPEMVDVAVGVDHGFDGPISPVLAIQRQRGGRGLGADQRVDHDDAGVALDEADIRQVQPAYLVDTGRVLPRRSGHLVQPLLGAQLGLPPQARVHRIRRLARQERIGVVVPDHFSTGAGHHARVQCADEPAVGVGEVAGVVERQAGAVSAVGGGDGGGGRLLLHGHDHAT